MVAWVHTGISQMNFQDSTVQVISYYELGESYSYSVEVEEYKVEAKDTFEHEFMYYDLDVTVIDSTENSYILRWTYSEIESESEDTLLNTFISSIDKFSIDVLTDEYGVIKDVLNWENVRDYMLNVTDSLKLLLDNVPEINAVLDEFSKIYTSKEGVMSFAIQDVQQLHDFFGAKFTLDREASGVLKTPNIYYPEEPFDMSVSVIVEKMDSITNDYYIRSIKEIDSDQLTETTYNYLKKLSTQKNTGFMEREDFFKMTNLTETLSQIHNTGWVLGSVQWKEVSAEGYTKMEVRRIQMK